jgi:hypothetical protein
MPQEEAPKAPAAPQASLPASAEKAAVITGMNPSLMGRMALAESGGKVDASNPDSTARGLYQINKPTWMSLVSKYGDLYGVNIKDIENPDANALMAARLAKDNSEALQAEFKRKPSDGEIYLAHFLGLKDAIKLMKATPSQAASLLFPKAAKANRAIFFDGKKPRSVAEVYQLITSKV